MDLATVTKRREGPRRPGSGGRRANAGRKAGARRRLSEQAILETKAAGKLLPHEWLLDVMASGKMDGKNVSQDQRLEAAKAAAPYYAAKLISVESKIKVQLIPPPPPEEVTLDAARRIAFLFQQGLFLADRLQPIEHTATTTSKPQGDPK